MLVDAKSVDVLIILFIGLEKKNKEKYFPSNSDLKPDINDIAHLFHDNAFLLMVILVDNIIINEIKDV